MKRLLGGSIFAIALVLALGPPALGHVAKVGYRDLLVDLLAGAPDREILQNSYHQGWFASSAALEVLIPADPAARPPAAPTRIRLDSRIQQGPGIWFTPRFPPLLGRVQTRAEIQGLPLALPALMVQTDLQVDGSALMRLQAPAGETAVTAEALGLRHGELSGEVRLASDREAISGRLVLTDLAVLATTGPIVRLSELELEADLPSDSAGTGRLDVARVEVDGMASGIGSTPIGAPGIRLEGFGIRMVRDTRDGRLDARLSFSATELSTAGETYGPSEMVLAAERLDTDALVDLAEGMRLLGSGRVSQEMRGLITAGLMARLLPRLAASGARLAVDPVRIQTPKGPAMGRLDLRLDPDAPLPRWPSLAFGDWLALFQVDGELSVPEAVALSWLERFGDERSLSLSDTNAIAAAREEADELLGTWTRGGWISRQDGRVASAVRLGDGLLTVNGKTLPIR